MAEEKEHKQYAVDGLNAMAEEVKMIRRICEKVVDDDTYIEYIEELLLLCWLYSVKPEDFPPTGNSYLQIKEVVNSIKEIRGNGIKNFTEFFR